MISTGTDVDLQNRLDGFTPLHMAAKLEHEAARQGVIDMLLDAGADPRYVETNDWHHGLIMMPRALMHRMPTLLSLCSSESQTEMEAKSSIT